MRPVGIALNSMIVLATAFILVRYFREDGKWSLKKGIASFRFFTVLSNALCAVSAIAVIIGQMQGRITPAVLFVKYLGTASVTVTLLTVLFFLGPTMGYKGMYAKDNLYMHLIGPVLAIVSFCAFEKTKMSFPFSLLGTLPVIIYGLLYLNRTVYAPQDKRWDDFYGFNKGGRWPVYFAGMMIEALFVCFLLWIL